MQNRRLCILSGVLAFFFLCFFNPVSGASKDKPIELKASSTNPSQLAISKLVQEWGKKVEERSGGKVKITFYWAGELATYRDNYRIIQSGVADLGSWTASLIMGAQPLHEFMSLPFMGWDNMFTINKIYHDLRKKFPELDQEFKGLRCLFTHPMPGTQIHMTKKSVRLPQDLQGEKVLGGANLNPIIELAGGVPVDKAPQDWYLSIQKGLVNGIFTHWAAVDGYKLTELFSSHTEMGDSGISTAMMGWYMNEKSWNKLPPEAKKAFIDLKDWIQQEMIKTDLKLIDQGRENARHMGHEIIQCTKEEIKAWADITKPIRDQWIAETEKKGLPARDLYDEVQRLIKQYSTN